MSRSPAIFTIGHSNHPLVKFLELLTRHGVEKVVDVRSTPHSRFVPHFNKKRLDAALQDSGIEYLHLGHCLGGRPKDRQFYDENGHVQYDLLALSKEFRECIDRLFALIPSARIALLCGEENPSRCHRRLLITPVLVARGVEVTHIRGDGRLENEESLAEAERGKKVSDQSSLFK